MLIEVLSLIQGHYEASLNWQKKANAAMEAVCYKPCPHDPSIYSHPNKDLVLQIDDFLCSMKMDEEFQTFLGKLQEHMNMEREGDLAPLKSTNSKSTLVLDLVNTSVVFALLWDGRNGLVTRIIPSSVVR